MLGQSIGRYVNTKMEEPVPVRSKSDLPELTRRDFVQIGSSVAALISCGKAWSTAPHPARDFEHGNPLREFRQYGLTQQH